MALLWSLFCRDPNTHSHSPAMKQGLGWPIADPEYPPGYLGLLVVRLHHGHGLLEMSWVPSGGDNRKAAEDQPLP